MSSIMRWRSGLMGCWLIGEVLVLRLEVQNPSILKTGRFASVTVHPSGTAYRINTLPRERVRPLAHGGIAGMSALTVKGEAIADQDQ